MTRALDRLYRGISDKPDIRTLLLGIRDFELPTSIMAKDDFDVSNSV
jgi:hypothetical protein